MRKRQRNRNKNKKVETKGQGSGNSSKWARGPGTKSCSRETEGRNKGRRDLERDRSKRRRGWKRGGATPLERVTHRGMATSPSATDGATNAPGHIMARHLRYDYNFA